MIFTSVLMLIIQREGLRHCYRWLLVITASVDGNRLWEIMTCYFVLQFVKF